MHDISSPADGTPQSIYMWGKNVFSANAYQERAFQIITAKFVLTFCQQADGTMNASSSYPLSIQRKYLQNVEVLKEMVGNPVSAFQLCMLLCGGAGTGKMKVIEQVLCYAKCFCKNIHQPFTENTILITTCQPLSSTSLKHQTIHSAICKFKRIRDITMDVVHKFSDSVKMVVIDKISMLTAEDISFLDQRMRWLKQNYLDFYGGVDVIFVGDLMQLPPVGKVCLWQTQLTDIIE